MGNQLDRRFYDLTPELQEYCLTVTHILQSYLGDDLLGVYLVGSAALGGLIPGKSDIDIQAVCASELSQEKKEALVTALAHPALPCPTRGCEFVLYTNDLEDFQINLNSGPHMPLHVSYDPREESEHWFIIDRAIARDQGIPLYGPDPKDIFKEISAQKLLDTILTSFRWHELHDTGGYGSILSACRGWRFAEEHIWSSKVDAAAWAKERITDPDLIDHALALRAGTTNEQLDPNKVKHFLKQLRTVLHHSSIRYHTSQ